MTIKRIGKIKKKYFGERPIFGALGPGNKDFFWFGLIKLNSCKPMAHNIARESSTILIES